MKCFENFSFIAEIFAFEHYNILNVISLNQECFFFSLNAGCSIIFFKIVSQKVHIDFRFGCFFPAYVKSQLDDNICSMNMNIKLCNANSQKDGSFVDSSLVIVVYELFCNSMFKQRIYSYWMIKLDSSYITITKELSTLLDITLHNSLVILIYELF